MKVKELMTRKVISVAPDDTLDHVFFLFNFESIRHLPVVEKGKLVGLLSDRDLKKVLGSPRQFPEKSHGLTLTISSRRVDAIMRRRVVTTGPEERAADAAALMVSMKLGALPVVKSEKLVGIISATDILKAYVRLCNNLEKVDFKAFTDLFRQLETLGKLK